MLFLAPLRTSKTPAAHSQFQQLKQIVFIQAPLLRIIKALSSKWSNGLTAAAFQKLQYFMSLIEWATRYCSVRAVSYRQGCCKAADNSSIYHNGKSIQLY